MAIEKQSLVGITEADGAQTINLRDNNKYNQHQIQIEVSAQPAAGVMSVDIKTPGASGYASIESSIDMTEITATAAKIIQFSGLIETIKFTSASFDAAKTYSVYMASWRE